MSFSRILTILGLIVVGVLSRLLPHPPNFTSMNAIALFGAFFLQSCPLSFLTVCLTLFLSDFIIGFYTTMPFVYFSFGLMSLLGMAMKPKLNLKQLPIFSFASSALFFVVTNFGEWFSGCLYPKTLQGLMICYTAAIPFFTTQVFGDLFYSFLIFGIFNYLNSYQLKHQVN